MKDNHNTKTKLLLKKIVFHVVLLLIFYFGYKYCCPTSICGEAKPINFNNTWSQPYIPLAERPPQPSPEEMEAAWQRVCIGAGVLLVMFAIVCVIVAEK